MVQRGLRTVDLTPIFGARSITSLILSGKRELSKAHIRKLAELFTSRPRSFWTLHRLVAHRCRGTRTPHYLLPCRWDKIVPAGRPLMRHIALPLLLFGALALSGCASALHSQQPPSTWTTGLWFWQGSSVVWSTAKPLDVLYFQVGEIVNHGAQSPEPWSIWAELPNRLPAAREYWLVFRFDRQAVPDLQAAPLLAWRVSQLRAIGQQRHLNVVGVQLDIDSPTRSLPAYAVFLREVRKKLPAEVGISITGLLDWFRSGTAIADVVKEVDEFVPQFYDVSANKGCRDRGQVRWRPVEIGVQSFWKTIPNWHLQLRASAVYCARRRASEIVVRRTGICRSDAARHRRQPGFPPSNIAKPS